MKAVAFAGGTIFVKKRKNSHVRGLQFSKILEVSQPAYIQPLNFIHIQVQFGSFSRNSAGNFSQPCSTTPDYCSRTIALRWTVAFAKAAPVVAFPKQTHTFNPISKKNLVVNRGIKFLKNYLCIWTHAAEDYG